MKHLHFYFSAAVAVVCLIILLLPGRATAVTLDFDMMPEVTFDPYYEDGFEVTGLSPDFWFMGSEGSLHIDIALGPYEISYQIMRTDGGLFSFASLDTVMYGSDYYFPDDPDDDLLVMGFNDGTQTGSVYGTSQTGGETVFAGAGFGAIDRLVVTGLSTDNTRDGFTGADIHLGVDNIVLGAAQMATPVPLPVGAALLPGAIGCLMALRRRRARTAASA